MTRSRSSRSIFSGLPPLSDLRSTAQAIGVLADRGYVVVLDEFQYFSRKQLSEFISYLQDVVDERSARASRVPGGLIVLGSIHTDMIALLEDLWTGLEPKARP